MTSLIAMFYGLINFESDNDLKVSQLESGTWSVQSSKSKFMRYNSPFDKNDSCRVIAYLETLDVAVWGNQVWTIGRFPCVTFRDTFQFHVKLDGSYLRFNQDSKLKILGTPCVQKTQISFFGQFPSQVEKFSTNEVYHFTWDLSNNTLLVSDVARKEIKFDLVEELHLPIHNSDDDCKNVFNTIVSSDTAVSSDATPTPVASPTQVALDASPPAVLDLTGTSTAC